MLQHQLKISVEQKKLGEPIGDNLEGKTVSFTFCYSYLSVIWHLERSRCVFVPIFISPLIVFVFIPLQDIKVLKTFELNRKVRSIESTNLYTVVTNASFKHVYLTITLLLR